MASPFAQLPEELFLLIIDTAVEAFLITDRATLVQLAQASRGIYDRVAPSLYHTIVVSNFNHDAISEFVNAEDLAPLAARVFHHTRSLHIVDSATTGIPAALLSNVQNIQAPFNLIRNIATEADKRDAGAGIPASAASSCSIRRMYVWYAKYHRIIELSVRARANITHICGYASDGSNGADYRVFLDDPAGWMCDIIEALPNLTHLALDLVFLRELDSYIVDEWDVEAFGKAMDAALSHQRLDVVAVRVTGWFIKRWDDIIRMLCQISGSDRRMHAWKDDRGARRWDEEDAMCALDAAQGRSIWTSISPVQDLRTQ